MTSKSSTVVVLILAVIFRFWVIIVNIIKQDTLKSIFLCIFFMEYYLVFAKKYERSIEKKYCQASEN